MQYLPGILYPDHERPQLTSLEALFREWHQHFSEAGTSLEKHKADDMVFDGFYPHYFSQNKRILFIGREARWISGKNYIDVIYPCYRTTKHIGTGHLNADRFHSRMIYIAYGVMKGMPAWQDIPPASESGDTFATSEGISFAFMNISKLSNDGDAWQSDWGVIDESHRLSTESRSFNMEEVAILEPDIVITMNLGNKLSSLGTVTEISTTCRPYVYWLDSGNHRSLLIDTWHFAAWTKHNIQDYYVPICDAVRRNKDTGVANPTG